MSDLHYLSPTFLIFKSIDIARTGDHHLCCSFPDTITLLHHFAIRSKAMILIRSELTFVNISLPGDILVHYNIPVQNLRWRARCC